MSDRRIDRRRSVLGTVGATLIAGLLLLGGQIAAPPAHALDLPTWEEVEQAKGNEAAAAAKVKEIEKLIADGAVELDRLRNLHSSTIQELQAAEAALAAAADKAKTLEEQAAKSREEADVAAEQAAAIVAQMYRSGGIDRSAELFLETEGETADALLDRLASMSKATERNTTISEAAEQAKNTAESLGKQAQAAAEEREVLRQDKEAKEQAAAEAVSTQGALVQAQEQQQADLEIKLEALKDTTTKTVAGYQERLRIEEEQRKAAEEAARKAAEEAARKAAEDAANSGGGGGGWTPPPPSGGGGGGGGGGGVSNGWVIPTTGYYVSEGFGLYPRNHTGIDLATACWTPIYAAAEGTVGLTYFEYGAGGNMVTINHPNGWQTRYAHMVQWASVSPGQYVYAGQIVGYVGTTGASTGCHLHFEMRPNQDNGWYGFVDPAWYIAF
ncbi:peptidoglycan DD-metalloendopeptidase family protein [Leucobacter sp. gxy201]|uniref:peptidoglycan DD-metalloendopeptidase family protein n=1 Tax=Leucobacter sp. gxy201 TaxID=2957200 RepID=UPI003D9FD031